MRLSFIGDVCPARLIFSKYAHRKYQIVHADIVEHLNGSDYVVANLEAPITVSATTDGDHLSFRGNPEILEQFGFVDCFSLSNNHINDCGTIGMDETVASLNKKKIQWNGLFKDDYIPFLIHSKNEKIAIITCTDMMNIPFECRCRWKTLHIDDEELDNSIVEYKSKGYFVILFAHVGILFTRFLNPEIRELIFNKIDLGVGAVVTAHSHCIGGMELYKGKPVFHSIGDFVMDGASFRRRSSVVLDIIIENKKFKKYEIHPSIINYELETVFAPEQTRKKMLKSWNFISSQVKAHKSNYKKFFNKQYKKEMVFHALSTLIFLYKTKGIFGLLRLIIMRFEEAKRMLEWITINRSNDRRDDEAILKTRKRFSQEQLYGAGKPKV